MKFNLPKIYPITDRNVSGLAHVDQVRLLIEGGAQLIQLRDKSADAGEFYDAAVEVVNYARRFGVKIIVNDRVDIALAAGADGVHLGQDDLPPDEARKLLGDDAVIGFSTHSIAQAREGIRYPVDYIAIGPVFATGTKPDHDPVLGLEGLTSVRAAIGQFPLVAIGGISSENSRSVLSSGADGVAIISALLSDPNDIAVRMRALSTGS